MRTSICEICGEVFNKKTRLCHGANSSCDKHSGPGRTEQPEKFKVDQWQKTLRAAIIANAAPPVVLSPEAAACLKPIPDQLEVAKFVQARIKQSVKQSRILKSIVKTEGK